MKYRIKERPTGYYSVNGGPLAAWPAEGETVDLTPAQAEGMIRSGHIEAIAKAEPEVETRPAPTADVETRAPKKQAAKRTETRKD